MRKMPRFFLIPIMVVMMGIFFATEGAGTTSPEAESADALVVASIAGPTNLIPLFASDSPSAQVSRLLFNGLVKYDKDLRLVGDLAERWEILEGGLRIVFYLRKDVRWQDGQPFTAGDVEFTYSRLVDPNVPTPYGGDFERVRSLRVLDAHTIEVAYKEPFAPALASWTMGLLPRHLLEKENLLETPFARRPVGTGPYRLRRWKTGEKIELEANPLYHEGKPGIARILYRVIPDPATAFLELQTENLDLAGLTPLQFSRLTDTAFIRKTYRKFRFASPAYTYIGYNLRRPLFSDVRVRKAISLAISRRELIDVLLLGMGRPCTGPFLPGTWAYNANVPETDGDAGAAARLLDEAGWRDSDGDGIRDRQGRSFSFTLLTNLGNTERKMAAEIIQRKLREVGIDMKIQILEWGLLLKQFVEPREFDALLLGWQMSPEPDIYDLFHSSKTESPGFNFVGYRNPEADALLESGRMAFGEEERAKAYHRLHALLSRDEPYAFLYVADALPAVHARFRGVEQAPAGILHNLIRWFVPRGERRYAFSA